MADAVDRRSVVEGKQAKQLLAAVETQLDRQGPRLVGFFACMYYAALRPAKVDSLRVSNLVSLSERGWGEMVIGKSMPKSERQFSSHGTAREERGLKHRAAKDTRVVPIHHELVAILRAHIGRFGETHGRLFAGRCGGVFDVGKYGAVWAAARRKALTEEEAASPLAARPFEAGHGFKIALSRG